MNRLVLLGAFLFGVWAASAIAAPHAHGCAFSVAPTTYDPPRDREVHMTGLELAGYNMIAPDDTFFGTPNVETGTRSDRTIAEEPYIPPTLLKATGWIESSIAQADWNTPFGAVGPALISFDCGHGIMQITSGMTSPADTGPANNGWPSRQQALVATHYLFNIARGAAILVDKWNGAPQYRPIAGTDTEGDPTIVENWYFAVWGYNGFTGPGANRSNHPSDPDYSWPRTGYSCGPLDDGYGHSYGNYPYQELVFGCAARPPSVDEQQVWSPLGLSLPDLDDPRWSDALSLDNWADCNVRLDCAAMDIPSPSPRHQDPTERPGDQVAPLLLGSPVLAASHDMVDQLANEVTIYNVGSGILAWRARHEEDWFAIDKQGGVALSADVPCASEAPCERSPTLTITIDPNLMPGDGEPGWVDIESLTSGQLWQVRVDPKITPVATPTAAPTAIPTPTPSGPVGDVNCNGTINSIDAALILQFNAGITNSLACAENADANADGSIDVIDATLIMQFVSGLLDRLPP